MKILKFSQIRIDGGTQMRVSINQDKVKQLIALESSITPSNLTPTVVKDLILATDLTKVYHHGFDS